jgi:prephenate dehydrogenase
MPPSCISVIGLGLLGGSLCQGLRAGVSPPRVIGFAHRPSTVQRARSIGLADEVTADLALAVTTADLVILATPVSAFEGLLRDIAPHLKPGTVVSDVGSTKRTVCRLAREILPKSVSFVGAHPMAGGEQSGAEHAKASLFHGAPVILTPEADTPASPVEMLTHLWTSLGAWVTCVDPASHDRLVATMSHLPHMTAAMLVTLQSPSALELSGPGFRDTTRVAQGDANLWRDILLDNRDNVAAQLRRLVAEAAHLAELLDNADDATIRDYLASAAVKRGAALRTKTPMV